jgi:hypothetical protein
MDINTVNPGAHADQTDFPIGGGETKYIPAVAKGQAVTAAARKLVKGIDLGEGVTLSLPADAAMAIATAVVNPTALRLDIERRQVHFRDTPSGYTIVSLQARAWSAAISADGANGRGMLDSLLSHQPVWPEPVPGEDAVMQYVTRDADRMRQAVRANASSIASPDMRERLRSHPAGVWNPGFAVPARLVTQESANSEPGDAAAFVHTVEGSTRVVTCQEGLSLERDLPLKFAGDTLELVRRVRASVALSLSGTPGSDQVYHMVKVITLPMRFVIGVLDATGQPTDPADYPHILSEFVASIHEEPRPWKPLSQGGVRGHRLVGELAKAGYLTSGQAADITCRDEHHVVSTRPNVIGGRLLRAVTASEAYDIVRKGILESGEARLTSRRYRETVGSLLLTVYRDTPGLQKNVVAALTSEFQPAALKGSGWEIREEIALEEVRDEALDALATHPDKYSPASLELVARSLGALGALGLLYSDQGSSVGGESWLRGGYGVIVNQLGLCAGGLYILCEAAKRAEALDGGTLMPMLRTADGMVVVDDDGNTVHLDPAGGAANLMLRRLANRDRKPEEQENEDQSESAYDIYMRKQRHLANLISEARSIIEEVVEIKDVDGNLLIDTQKLSRSLLADAPKMLMDVRDYVMTSLVEEDSVEEEAHDDDLASFEDLIPSS